VPRAARPLAATTARSPATAAVRRTPARPPLPRRTPQPHAAMALPASAVPVASVALRGAIL
jgi:hypothetical protein